MKQTLAAAPPICSPASRPQEVIGIDLGDRWSRYCVLDQVGTVVEEDRVRTTPEALQAKFGELPAIIAQCLRAIKAFIGERTEAAKSRHMA
jgi:predicted NBD/HSP70 family sugar kinase